MDIYIIVIGSPLFSFSCFFFSEKNLWIQIFTNLTHCLIFFGCLFVFLFSFMFHQTIIFYAVFINIRRKGTSLCKIKFDFFINRELDGHMADTSQGWNKTAVENKKERNHNLATIIWMDMKFSILVILNRIMIMIIIRKYTNNKIRYLYKPLTPSSRAIRLRASVIPLYGMTPILIPWVYIQRI